MREYKFLTDELLDLGEKCKKWSPRRWAWEFLRRNEDFRADCDTCGTAEDRKVIAKKYGIKIYKHYSEEHKLGDMSTSFMVGRPMFYSYYADKAKKGIHKRKIFLKENQFLVKCDLSEFIEYPWLAKTLIKKIEKRVRRDLNDINLKKHPNFVLKTAIKHLMVLDLWKDKKKYGMKNYEIYQILHPEDVGDDKYKLNQSFNDLKDAAVKVTKESYRYYAMLSRSDLK